MRTKCDRETVAKVVKLVPVVAAYLERSPIDTSLDLFAVCHYRGNEALEDLAAFILYAIHKDLPDSIVCTTLAHDIYQTRDMSMLPRTTGYKAVLDDLLDNGKYAMLADRISIRTINCTACGGTGMDIRYDTNKATSGICPTCGGDGTEQEEYVIDEEAK